MRGALYLRNVQRAFSLVEVLAAITIIGLITFLAIPNILRVKEDGETSLAISRAEAINLATSSFIQAQGLTTASNSWAASTNRYGLISPYLFAAPASSASYMPGGYGFSFSTNMLSKVILTNYSGTIAY